MTQALGARSRTEAAVALGALGLGRGDPAEREVPGFGARPPIAVLPFEGTAAGVRESWFTEGLTIDLCRRLGATRWLPVIDPDSSLTFGSGEPAERAGQELGVRYIVQASVARSGYRLALAVKLLHLNAGTGLELVWADRFEVDVDELVDAHRQVVDRIVAELVPALLEIDRVHHMRARAEQIRVWEQCQQTAAWLRRESLEGFAQARTLLEDAARIDPLSSRAWTGIPNAWNDGYYLGFVALDEYAGPARDAARSTWSRKTRRPTWPAVGPSDSRTKTRRPFPTSSARSSSTRAPPGRTTHSPGCCAVWTVSTRPSTPTKRRAGSPCAIRRWTTFSAVSPCTASPRARSRMRSPMHSGPPWGNGARRGHSPSCP